ncbi:MAG: oligosaccharide flippase family protein [Christensenellaceae bacterium]|nr:oligosaccharide flippase family protein [Christensenellaceae bacterium]
MIKPRKSPGRGKTIALATMQVSIFAVLTRAVSFVFKIYLSRTLGAEALGLYQMALSLFFLFAAFSSSGLSTVLSRKLSENRALSGGADFPLFTATLLIGVVVAVVSCGILVLAKPLLGYIVSDTRAVPLFMLMLPALITTAGYGVIRAWFWGTKKFTAFSSTELMEEILRVIFTLLFVSGVTGFVSGETGLALAFTVSDAVVAVILLVIFLKSGGKFAKPSSLKKILKPSLPVTAVKICGSLLGTLIAFIFPIKLMEYGLTQGEATQQFGRVAGMAAPLLFAPNAIIGSLAVVLVPEISEAGASKNTALISKRLNSAIIFSVICSGLFTAVYTLLGKDLTQILFNDTASGEYLTVAAWFLLIMPISQLTTSILNGIGEEKEAFFSFIVSSLVSVAAIWFLTPHIGVYAVAAANFLSLSVGAVINLYVLSKKADLQYDFIPKMLFVPISVILTGYIGKSIKGALETGGSPQILTTVIVGIVIVIAYAAFTIGTNSIDVSGFVKMRKTKTA